MQLRRSVAELLRNACYPATLRKAFRRNATTGGLFLFGKIISGMLIGSLFPADAACRVPTAFRDLGGWDAALAGSGFGAQKKERQNLCLSFLGGDYLLSHFRSTIGVVRLNFSVRNGKRWNPHAVITFVFTFANRSPAAVIS